MKQKVFKTQSELCQTHDQLQRFHDEVTNSLRKGWEIIASGQSLDHDGNEFVWVHLLNIE